MIRPITTIRHSGCCDMANAMTMKNDVDYATIEKMLLDLIDNKTEDGVLSLGVLRRNGIRFTDAINSCIRLMICNGILVERDSTNFSAERPGNPRSKWGMQKNFDQYIHLTKDELQKQIEDDNHSGLKIIVLDDVNSCICSQFVESEEAGAAFFAKYYTAPYTYHFFRIHKVEEEFAV